MTSFGFPVIRVLKAAPSLDFQLTCADTFSLKSLTWVFSHLHPTEYDFTLSGYLYLYFSTFHILENKMERLKKKFWLDSLDKTLLRLEFLTRTLHVTRFIKNKIHFLKCYRTMKPIIKFVWENFFTKKGKPAVPNFARKNNCDIYFLSSQFSFYL